VGVFGKIDGQQTGGATETFTVGTAIPFNIVIVIIIIITNQVVCLQGRHQCLSRIASVFCQIGN